VFTYIYFTTYCIALLLSARTSKGHPSITTPTQLQLELQRQRLQIHKHAQR